MNRLNLFLTALLILVAGLIMAGRIDYTQPNIEVLPDMKYTPAGMAYAENGVFANGRVLQAPVEGTIARGQMPIHYQATKEDAERAGQELLNPYTSTSDSQITTGEPASNETNPDDSGAPADHADTDHADTDHADTDGGNTEDADTEGAESAADAAAKQANDRQARLAASIIRGGEHYRVFCVSCHGGTGNGDGPVAKRGYPPPPSMATGKSRQMKDGQLFHILTYGQANMPNFAAQLAPADRWDMVNYLRKLQQDAQPTDNQTTDNQTTDNQTTGAESTTPPEESTSPNNKSEPNGRLEFIPPTNDSPSGAPPAPPEEDPAEPEAGEPSNEEAPPSSKPAPVESSNDSPPPAEPDDPAETDAEPQPEADEATESKTNDSETD